MDESGIKKQNWDVKETELFLEILKELDMKKCLDGRKVRNNRLFKVAHRRMTAAGYHRSVDQLKFRWKLLKSAYYKCKREPDSSSPIKIQGWWRYEKTMVAIMESRHPLVGAEVNADGNDDVTEDSDGEASILHWPQSCPDNNTQNNSSTQNLDLIVGVIPRSTCSQSVLHEVCGCMMLISCVSVNKPLGLDQTQRRAFTESSCQFLSSAAAACLSSRLAS